MKRALCKIISFIVLSIWLLMVLGLGTMIAPQGISAAPPTQGSGGSLTPEEAFQSTLDSYVQRTSPTVRFELTEIKKDDSWAYAVAEPIQSTKETFVVLLARKDHAGHWFAIAPVTSPARAYNRLLKAFPATLFDERTKDFLQQPESSGAITNFGGHKLPWVSGQSGYVTKKDNCSAYGCSGSGHENQIDFDILGSGSSGNVYASKPGTVVFVKESSSSGCGSLSCWQQANMVVIQHGGGEYSWYVHLGHNSVTVNVGDSVSFGRMIAVEGSTGYSSAVHLHYMGSTSVPAWTDPSNPNAAPWPSGITPVDFAESSWSGLTPGQPYTSQNSGGGGGGPAGYTFCANENERCNFSGTKDVAYGANGSFNYKTNITGGIDCNNSTFGDPIPGVGKACYTKDSPPPTGCTPNSDQVSLFEHSNYGGNCKTFDKRDYANPGEMGFPNDSASSIKVGSNAKATLCQHDNYGGTCEEFTGDDSDLNGNGIGDNQVSSLKVQDRGGGGDNGIEICDGTNYGSPCTILTAGKIGNLNDIGWYDRIESLRFKGSYVGNYHVVLSTETNHGGTPGHYERDEANIPDPWRNHTRSIEIYYIDRNNPPGIPTLSSPGDWYESNDGTAPNLCWNSSSDPEGNNPVQYYAEVFDSAVNANSGWITDTCWRPGQLDSQYYSYQWRVRARDNKNKESDWSATRHFTIRQPAPQKPDLKPDIPDGYPAPLVPSSIQGTRQVNTLFANARTFIDWHFINAGNGVAPGGFYVDVYIDNERIVHYGQPDFNAGWRGGFDDWAVSVMAPGLHTLKIVTDPENVVQESDENNNVWEQQFTWVNINGWRGEYFKNPTLDSNPWLTRDDANIDFDWSGGSPDPALPADNFSARWTRTTAFECGRYRFNVRVDDGIRLWVNNQQLLNEWRTQVADFYPEIDLPAGSLPIQVEYYESGGGAAIQVNWQKLSSCVTPPAAPTLNNPANGSTKPYNHDLTFQWNSVAGATEYLLEWWGGPYSTTQQCAWSSNTSCHIGTVAAGATYSWRVKARNSAGESGWSGTWTFTIQPQPQPPAPPHDPNPANGAILSYRTTLDVSVQGEGDEFRIHVWGANYDRWRDWEASRSLQLDGLTSQTYNLQAQARNSAGTSNWSDVWTFTIEAQPQPPGAFDKTSPVNGAVNQPTNPTLSWNSSGGAASYEYCYDTLDNNACDGGWNNVGNTTSANLGGLNNGATYYWQVRAKNNDGVTDANTGAWWRFTTQSSFVNLVQNPGFELDADNNNIPDNWGANSKFTRANKPHYEGQYAGALGATDNRKVTIAQQIPNLSPGQTYNASCRVKIRKTTDTFTFKVQVRWLDSLNKTIRTDTIGKTFTGKTAGWEQVLRDVVAPTGATAARFQFTATSLNAKLNLDACAFTQR